ncbi:MAG: pyrimidine/purine nucleoside phosphorylase [Thermodesulfobacteriota bacterium]
MFKTNEYFDGKVKSIAFTSEEGPATIGVMAPGDYEFGTASVEIMRVVSGQLEIKLPDSDSWQTFKAGEEFEVAKDVKFGVKVSVESSYLCLYK